MKHVRDGKRVWPYCSDCGCRLRYAKKSDSEFVFWHFGVDSFNRIEDQRGHYCKSIGKQWIIPRNKLYVGIV